MGAVTGSTLGEWLLRPFRLISGLVYPRICLCCSAAEPVMGDYLCLPCAHALPDTGQVTQVENTFTDRFLGRVRLERGASLYYYSSDSRVQQLIHHLKYYHKPEIGTYFGNLLGKRLAAGDWPPVDAVIPVPLHPKKLHIRGYNQAERFGAGLAEALGVPQYPHGLRRADYRESQTRKGKAERLANVSNAFLLGTHDLTDKHILLVDDVLTTGATLESCAQPLVEVPGIKISMVTIAMAG
ncbi:MAG: phosphoribosyltransferase family protein [Saprospiraceae bacterium]